MSAKNISASSIGFMLAPRINAAGRMGKIELAVELFLTENPHRAAEVAKQLCDLNRQRQSVESEIYSQAVSMLPAGQTPEAIVLADESYVTKLSDRKKAVKYSLVSIFVLGLNGSISDVANPS